MYELCKTLLWHVLTALHLINFKRKFAPWLGTGLERSMRQVLKMENCNTCNYCTLCTKLILLLFSTDIFVVASSSLGGRTWKRSTACRNDNFECCLLGASHNSFWSVVSIMEIVIVSLLKRRKGFYKLPKCQMLSTWIECGPLPVNYHQACTWVS